MDFNDGPPSENPFGCDPDPEQIAVFLDTVFSWCEGLIPLRGFVDKGQGKDGRPHNIWIDADATAPEKLATFAGWAAREGAAQPSGAAPPHPFRSAREMLQMGEAAGLSIAAMTRANPPPLPSNSTDATIRSA